MGKSTLSSALARVLGATHLDKDAIDECFSPGDRGQDYSRRIEPMVLQALLNLAELNLREGAVVILDVPWTHILLNSPDWVARLEDLRDRRDATLSVLELVLEEGLLRKRMAERGLDRDQVRLTPEGWMHFRREDRLGELPPLPHSRIRADLEPDQMLTEALRVLEQN